MLERHAGVVVSHISERTSSGKHNIFTLEFALSQLRVFLLVDELTRSEIKTCSRNIRGTQRQAVPG